MYLTKTTLVMAACLLLAGPATLVGVETAQAEPLSCEEIRTIADGSQPLVDGLNGAGYAGYERKYGKLKKFRINRLADITPDECGAYLEFDVTLKRTIRPDAHGIMIVRGTLSADRYGDVTQICVSDAEVIDLELSNTAWLGEQFYEWIAHLVPPDLEKCVEIP